MPLAAKPGSSVTVRDSLASGGAAGFDGENNPGMGAAPTELNLENCVAFGQSFGGIVAANTSTSSTTVRLSNSTVIIGGFEVVTGAGSSTPLLLSRSNNTIEPPGAGSGTYSAK